MRIIKRKKGGKEYYYLQHSVRKGNKVITREKYLGIKIPEDIENIKSNFMKMFEKNLMLKIESIKANFQKEWEKYPNSIKEKLKDALIQWSHTDILFPQTLDEFERILIDIKNHKLEEGK